MENKQNTKDTQNTQNNQAEKKQPQQGQTGIDKDPQRGGEKKQEQHAKSPFSETNPELNEKEDKKTQDIEENNSSSKPGSQRQQESRI